MAGVTWACLLLVLLNSLLATAKPPPPDPYADEEARVETVDSYGENEPENHIGGEDPFPPPPPGGPGGPPWGPNSEQLAMLRKRLTLLKAKYDALNETEKAAIRERAKAYREKMAEMPPPPPPMCPPCPCMEEGYEEGDEELEGPPMPPPGWPRYPPPPPPWARHRHSPYGGPPPGYSRKIEEGKSRKRRHARRHANQWNNWGHSYGWGHGHGYGNLGHGYGNNANSVWADLVQTFNVEDDMEWWFKDNMGEEDEVSASIASWDPGYATHSHMMKQMDLYSPALHIGGIDTGEYLRPERYDPGKRMFGYNSDFNPHELHHAFAKTPTGQFSISNHDDFHKWEAGDFQVPYNAEFIYHPNPKLQAIQGISADKAADAKNVLTSKNLDSGAQRNLPDGTYSLKWYQEVHQKDTDGKNDETKPTSFNVVLRNVKSGRFYGVKNIDWSQLQDSTPFRVGSSMVESPWDLPFDYGQGEKDPGYLVNAPPVQHYGNYGPYPHYWETGYPHYYPLHEAHSRQYNLGYPSAIPTHWH